VGEPAHAADFRTHARNIGHDCDLAFVANGVDHGLGHQLTGGAVVGRQERLIIFLGAFGEHGVDDYNRDAAFVGALYRGHQRFGIDGASTIPATPRFIALSSMLTWAAMSDSEAGPSKLMV